jgi:hypothetical protein
VPQSKLWRKEKKPKKPKKPKIFSPEKAKEKTQNSSIKKSPNYKKQGENKRLENTKKIGKSRSTTASSDGSRPPRRKFKP